MKLGDELRDQIDRFLAGQSSLPAFREWLIAHADAIDETGEPALVELSDKARIYLYEFGDGHRDEQSVKSAVHALVRERRSEPIRTRPTKPKGSRPDTVTSSLPRSD